jgi:hypothetical protein
MGSKTLTMAQLKTFFRTLKQRASNGQRYINMLRLWLRQARKTQQEQAEVPPVPSVAQDSCATTPLSTPPRDSDPNRV